jgi:A118 family predicted phage portal protein
MNLQQFFSNEGYDISEKLNWEKYIDIWSSWYRGKVRRFHNYYIYNGQRKVKMEKKSMQGAKKVAEDWADLLFNEKVSINLQKDEDTKALNEILQQNNAEVIINQGLEKSFAIGTGALVVSVQDIEQEENILDVTNAKIKLEFVECKKIIPLTWENGKITECAFVTTKHKKGQTYIYIAMHVFNDKGNYVIKNYMFKGKYSSFVEANEKEKEGFLEEFDTQSDIPWFSIIKPNICNNIDSETPFGLSVYANAIDTLKCLDNAYDGLDNETTIGRRRIFVSSEMLSYDDGEGKMVFDPNDISVYRMPQGFKKDQMIEHDDANLRSDQFISTVNYQLNILSSKVGFGQERYKFDGQAIQTATGVISENSDMFRTIKKHEQMLEDSLITIIKAIAYASTVFGNVSIDASVVTIDFDDSIIEDRGAEKVRAMQEVSQNLRSKESYMINYRNLNEQQVKEELEKIQQEKMSNQEAFGFTPNNAEEEE